MCARVRRAAGEDLPGAARPPAEQPCGGSSGSSRQQHSQAGPAPQSRCRRASAGSGAARWPPGSRGWARRTGCPQSAASSAGVGREGTHRVQAMSAAPGGRAREGVLRALPHQAAGKDSNSRDSGSPGCSGCRTRAGWSPSAGSPPPASLEGAWGAAGSREAGGLQGILPRGAGGAAPDNATPPPGSTQAPSQQKQPPQTRHLELLQRLHVGNLLGQGACRAGGALGKRRWGAQARARKGRRRESGMPPATGRPPPATGNSLPVRGGRAAPVRELYDRSISVSWSKQSDRKAHV